VASPPTQGASVKELLDQALSFGHGIPLFLFGITQFFYFMGLTTNDGRSGRARSALRHFFVRPYQRGIVVGDLFRLVYFLPALLLTLVLFGTLYFVIDVFCFVYDLKLTSPRTEKES
jgi:hypothetical protein